MIEQLDKFHKTRAGLAVFVLVELALFYLFIALALNSGSLWQWVLAALFLFGTLQNLVKFLGALVHGKQ
jgi:hypothetical protein